MKTKSSPITKTIEFEQKFTEYFDTSIKDLVLTHCVQVGFLSADDITGKTKKFGWVTEIVTLHQDSESLIHPKEKPNLVNIDRLIEEKHRSVNRIILALAKTLTSCIPPYRK